MLRVILKERLSEALEAKGIDAKQLAKSADVPLEAIQTYQEKGEVPDHEAMKRISDTLGVSIPYLMDWSSLYPEEEDSEAALPYQVIDSITLDDNGRIVENFEDSYEVIPQPWLFDQAPNSYFVMRAKDSLMAPIIMPGDLMFCRKAPAVPNGTVSVVLRDRGPATSRYVSYDNDGTLMRLYAQDPYAPARVIKGEALENCHVIGEVKRVLRVVPEPAQ